METLLFELRFCLRTLRKSPGFVIVAIFTLGLGIAASTTIFSVLDAVVLSPLPYPNAQQIVRVWEQGANGHQMNLSDPDFDDFRSQNRTLSTLAKYNFGPLSVTGGSEPVRLTASEVSGEFFAALGVKPFVGRTFAPEEMQPNGAPAAIVSYGYWHTYLGDASDLAKVQLRMNGRSYAVVGVMPRGFDFPEGAGLWMASELSPEVPSRTAHNWNGIGRISQGKTVGIARADLNEIARRIRGQYGEQVDLTGASVVPLPDALVGTVRPALLTLFGAVMLLFLVAAANVAGLLVARTWARQQDIAVCAALGAGRANLLLHFLILSFAVTAGGGVAGIAGAVIGVRALYAIAPADLPRHEMIGLDIQVLVFALLATLVLGLSLGLFAAWRGRGLNLQRALTDVSRSQTGTLSSHRVRTLLTVAEIAATFVILLGAGLLGRSFLRLVSISPGFHEENLVTAEFYLRCHKMPLWRIRR